MSSPLFPGFTSATLRTSAGRINTLSSGSGPPVVLLHGFPQDHAMWRHIAPALARRFTTVLMDLRGYGRSDAPPSSAGAAYTKRLMAGDVIEAMRHLGHRRFSIVGHDRGARVGYRLALDHVETVERLAVLDILPTVEVWRNIRSGMTPAAHWGFLARPSPHPEEEIGRAPDAYFEGLLAAWSASQSLSAFEGPALDAYRAAWRDPLRIHAMCEDYRAGATLDVADDEKDLAEGRSIACPVHVLSGEFYLTRPRDETAVEVWRRTFAPDAVGTTIESGHFLAEENAPATLAALAAFLQA